MARLAFYEPLEMQEQAFRKVAGADCKRVDSGLTEPVTLPKGRYIF